MPAASLLPVTIHNGKLYFLFGKENPLEDSSKGFSDFGGGKEDKSFYDTALREAAEELTGFFGPPVKLRKYIRKHGGTYILRHNPDTPDEYRVHIFYVEYDPIMVDMFNNNHQYLWERMDKHMLNKSKLFEKIEIRWFCETELLRKKPLYRHFYYDIVKDLVAHKEHIRKFIKTRQTKYYTRCSRCGVSNKSKTRKNVSVLSQQGGK
jgi:hypothetical protein